MRAFLEPPQTGLDAWKEQKGKKEKVHKHALFLHPVFYKVSISALPGPSIMIFYLTTGPGPEAMEPADHEL
jgi:hypothetical protein